MFKDLCFPRFWLRQKLKFLVFNLNPAGVSRSQGPHSYIFMMGGGGPSDFFGSEILAKSDLFGSMKGAGIFLGHEKKPGIFGGLQEKD